MLTFEQLVEDFQKLGVAEGDTLLVHSSYKSLGEVDGGPQTVVRALEAALGTNGTLIMPTFNFDFNKGVPWDVRKTRSKMGALTEVARMDPRAKRVFHPFYSFAILGKHAEMLVRDIDKGVMTMVDPMGALMEQAGIVRIRKIGDADVKLMKANEVYEFTAREMKRDPHLLYYIEKKE